MARTAAYLFVGGAVLGLVTAPLSAGAGANWGALLLIDGTGLAAAAALLLWGRHLPEPSFQVLAALGTMMISLAARFAGTQATSYAFLYVWIALYAFYFFRFSQTLLQLAIIAAACALVSAWSGAGEVPWLMIVGTIVVAGTLMHRLTHRIRVLAQTDPLTGAPNRRTWNDRLPAALDRSRRGGHRRLTIALLDIDHFKIYNDEQGHQAGDLLLQAIVEGWRDSLRTNDWLARYGGEEFAVLLPDCDPEDGLAVVDRLRAAVPSGLTCSAGVAIWDGKESADALVSRADAALYEAKRRGRDRTLVAPDPAASEDASGILGQSSKWASTVLEVMDHSAVYSVYQPVVRLADGCVAGYEALARPRGAAASLGVEGLFATAQRMGRILDLDWMCRRAAITGFARMDAGVELFLNVSVSALLDRRYDVEHMLLLMQWARRAPADVVLEITERETVTNLPRLRDVLAQHREHGFRIALDDVGEGHSTFEVLAAAQPEYVKIARSFTASSHSPGPRAAIRAAVAFALASGAEVIAEGIETPEEAARMAALGVTLGQGYLLGRPGRLSVAEGLADTA